MKKHHESRGLLAVTLFTTILTLGACSNSDGVHAKVSDTEGGAGAVEESEPVPERVLERSKARWDLIVQAGEAEERWIEVYEYLTPLVRSQYSITSYLPSKAKFYYDKPTKPKLLKIEGTKAFVAVSATWLAYRHPDVAKVQGGQSLVKLTPTIEEWHWVEGEWYLERPHRENEFHKANPDFFAPPPSLTRPSPSRGELTGRAEFSNPISGKESVDSAGASA